jgi:L-methionine (R)-S-oxide reductase
MSLDFQTTPDPAAWLEEVLCAFHCQTGTLHKADGEFLDLVIHKGVPDFLLPKITRIPFGKGIAGAAAERRAPVELCNLQDDLGGVARPDARQTQVSGSLAVPVFSPDGQRVLGTLGVGMHAPHDFTADEKARLVAIAARIGEVWSAN